MGLDMYLLKRRKDSEGHLDKQGHTRFTWDEVGYWRKANQVHKWFLDHCGLDEDFNCENAPLFKADLENLIDDCQYVLEHRHDENSDEIAEEFMPTQCGFFFGDYEYDDYYYHDLEDTIDIATKVINETDWENEIVCYSCWW